ncbi:MAG: hypothetical protein QF464_20295, partial [Myxococcota bacterium]|nr:hypothetical protein [Myxococcota bacterium]
MSADDASEAWCTDDGGRVRPGGSEESSEAGVVSQWKPPGEADPPGVGLEPEGAELLTMGASAQLPLQGRRLTRTIARDGDRILPACETPVVESRCRY